MIKAKNTIRAELRLDSRYCPESMYLAKELQLEIAFYEQGIMRMYITEDKVVPRRFRLTSHDLGSILTSEGLIPLQGLPEPTYTDNSLTFTFE